MIEFTPGYAITESGCVINLETGCIRKHTIRVGYPSVFIKGKNFHIHRLLAELYIPNPKNLPQVNHIDADRTNFSLSNLEWVTAKQNHRHAMYLGRHTCQTSPASKNARVKPEIPSDIKTSKSGIKGIQIHEGARGTKYRVFFNRGTRSKYLGSYSSLRKAKSVYKQAFLAQYGVLPKGYK